MNLRCGNPTINTRSGRMALGLVLGCVCASPLPAASANLGEIWRGTSWGEPGRDIVEHFGGRATILSTPLIYGDSYVQIVLRDVELGGVALIAFFQMDTQTGGLKRIQLERQRHGVNPPALRGVVEGPEEAFGAPDTTCNAHPDAANGFQAAMEFDWRRYNNVIRAIFRDTTIEAYEGCVTRDITTGPCGLTAQLLVRISPLGGDRPGCRARPGA